MFTTNNQALEIARTGDWNTAWYVAQLDEGFNKNVTKEQWIAYALKCIDQRMSEDRIAKDQYLSPMYS